MSIEVEFDVVAEDQARKNENFWFLLRHSRLGENDVGCQVDEVDMRLTFELVSPSGLFRLYGKDRAGRCLYNLFSN